MGLNPFIDPRKRTFWVLAPVRVRFVVRSKRHVVKPIGSVWIRIGERPTVIRALLYVDEFVRRMVVNVGGNQYPVVVQSAALPTVVEWVEDVIGFVDRGPKLIRTWDKCEPFGVADPSGEDLPHCCRPGRTDR